MVLLAEDLDSDVLLLRRAWKRLGLPNRLMVVRDGQEAIDYLQGSGNYSDRNQHPVPTLVLLDLTMPKTDGFAVLEWIRAQPTLRNLRVVVITASSLREDISRAYKAGANHYLVKPVSFPRLVDDVQKLRDFWLTLSQAPTVSRPPAE